MGNYFIILDKLAAENNQNLKRAPLSNIRNARKWKNGLGIVEIVVDEETIINLIQGNLIGGFIVANKEDFHRVEKEMGHLNKDTIKFICPIQPIKECKGECCFQCFGIEECKKKCELSPENVDMQ